MAGPGSRTILIVEDDEDLRSAVETLLETAGYAVWSAPEGKSGLAEIAGRGMPDLILLDMRMPVMDGWQFAAELKAKYPQRCPTVVMSAAADASRRAAEIQASGFLAKPFDVKALLALIGQFLHA